MNVLIKNIPKNDRPRERLINYGASNLSNEELLSIILRNGTKNKSVKDLSLMVLNKFGDIRNMRYIEINDILSINGIGKVKAIEIIASIEFGRRVLEDKEINNISIRSTKDVYEYFNNLFKDKKQEYFYVLYLDNKKKVLCNKLLYIGTINGSVAHPREIFKQAYLNSASFIICIHNHPSGDPSPSNEDLNFTHNLIEIGKLNNIPVLDHLIIGNNCYYSFFEGEKIN
ncbi:MAG: DNA repair protein RadC [Bacilli bacterium]|jgi:DNA repair protein RadC|nr:DNA repair protein RadC [Bacilli bacterium]